ncbi:pentapeptide repeat-containing protein [Streptomyces sp. GZWMJZ-114]|uniref:pentapeptide repeat-containing protein n=1 Tax=Streptomyces sp. GZWMJZ-114 TaxID=2494734 RepID=UPI001011A73D|nr:pentapeptide repeat-containing protein [Streptomyces sp. GZWMJZ-114]
MSTPEPPPWAHCAHGADPDTDPIGCRGIHVSGHTACLAHLADTDRDAYLASLAPGANIDHRGTTFTESLCTALLDPLRDHSTRRPVIGAAWFGSTIFEGPAWFGEAIFEGYANFAAATFKGRAEFGSVLFKNDAKFDGVTFESAAEFGEATFENRAWFESATFEGHAGFAPAIFKSYANFTAATFKEGPSFGSATFKEDTQFEWVTFEGSTNFESATFESYVGFGLAAFKGFVAFTRATFQDGAGFEAATFGDVATFRLAAFEGWAVFERATFKGRAVFAAATFESDMRFGGAIFEGDVQFPSVKFVQADIVGPFVCTGSVVLSGAVFGGPVTLSFVAGRLECRRTRWSSTAEIRLRYAEVDFTQAVFEYPLTIAAEPDAFLLANDSQLAEDLFPDDADPRVRVASLRGVDAAHLVLTDLDLSGCLFAGTVHLDQIRLEGACTFAKAPNGVHWRRWLPVRFTERRVLAEEHHWRASRPGAVPGWNGLGHGTVRTGPLQLAPVYRALRKSIEDGKHEPGAADFYYGETEMRRYADDIPRGERGLLTMHWAVSGYGLRASRALAWLGAAMFLTIVLLMAVGLAQDTPQQTVTGAVPAGGGRVTFHVDKDEPKNPTGERFTGERFEKALNLTLNSVVFRSSGQDLTTIGTYIELASRAIEPTLLGFVVYAVRNRVKR